MRIVAIVIQTAIFMALFLGVGILAHVTGMPWLYAALAVVMLGIFGVMYTRINRWCATGRQGRSLALVKLAAPPLLAVVILATVGFAWARDQQGRWLIGLQIVATLLVCYGAIAVYQKFAWRRAQRDGLAS